MKKKIYIFLPLLLCFIFSCKNNSNTIDSCGCYLNLEDAKKAASEQNKDIIALITDAGEDRSSEFFIENVLKKSKFKKFIKKNFVIYHFDHCKENFDKTVADETTDSKKKVQNAIAWSKIMQDGYDFSTYIGLTYTPSLFMLTKDGFVISEIEYTDTTDSVDAFIQLISSYEGARQSINNIVDRIYKETIPLKQLAAIEDLYATTPEKYQIFLTQLAPLAIQLDSENKSGKIGKYYLALAEEKAALCYKQGDISGAIEQYVLVAQNPALLAEEVQLCYYQVAFLLDSSGNPDIDLILKYINKAIDACPESKYAQVITQYLEAFIQNRVNVPQPQEQLQ